jgi:hypothetical protein
MDWFEPLPSECPPKKAIPTESITVYRITANPPKKEDFHSHRKIYPNKVFTVDSCIACSLSVFDTEEVAIKLIKLPRFKNKVVTELQLTIDDGVILKTSGAHHYSWWRSQKFNLYE